MVIGKNLIKFFMMEGNLRISSYNCAGFKHRNYNYINNLFNNCDILLLQETWLYNFEFKVFNNVINNSNYHAVSAMDETEIGRVGRPYGGCAIVWRRQLAITSTPIITNSPRICAVELKSDNIKLIIMSIYMPTDNEVSYIEYGDVLDEISSILGSYDNYDVVLGGDFNVDFSRIGSRNLQLLKLFISQEELTCATLQIVNNNYSRSDVHNNRSFIDHFIVSQNIDFNVSVSHDGDNLSDHDPITLLTRNEIGLINSQPCVKYINNWRDATEENIVNYKIRQNQKMIGYEIPDSIKNCTNLLCTVHNDLIYEKIDELLEILISSGDEVIPKKRISSNSKGGIMGWNDFVKPFKEKSIFWNNVWKNAGSPQQGELANVRRFARYKYHWALNLKKVRKQNDDIILHKTANQLLNKSFRHFWATIKNLKGRDNRISNVIDEKVNEMDIANHFGDIYANLYSSVEDEEFKYLDTKVNDLISDKCNSNKCESQTCHNITAETVKNAISKLNSGKDDETYHMYSDNFLHATDVVIDNLSHLITAMLKHGTASQLVNKAVIIPIPKNKQKSLATSNNYRAICKNTILSKILDYILIYQLDDKLNTSHYQFAYKAGFSTSLCSFLVAETIQYYRSRGSNVFMLSLDATKAYDRVQYTKLFNILINKNVCPLIIRFIMNIYKISAASVKWNNSESKSFPLMNGVKQGAVLSPPLFATYINPLLDQLHACKNGCYMGNLCANAFAYADDIILLSPTCTALRAMISICEKFSDHFKLEFNPEKCTLLIFSDNDFYFKNVKIRLCGHIIKNVKSEKHLGHSFENSYDIINIDSVIRDIKIRSNTIINTFRPMSWESKVLLFTSQCSSLYGCPLWNLDSGRVDRLCMDWNICCRRILGLPPTTRTYLIPHLMNILPIKSIIMKRIMIFFISGINHKCQVISNFFRNSLLSKSSHMYTNINTVMKYLNVSMIDIYNFSKVKTNQLFKSKADSPDWRAQYIRQLLHVRDKQLFIDLDLEDIDISSILNFMSTFR